MPDPLRSLGKSIRAWANLVETMSDRDGETPIIDPTSCGVDSECPPVASNTSLPKNKRSDTGCLILFLLAMPAVDAIGVVIPATYPYSHVVGILALGGFVFGALLGARVSVRIKHEPWSSSCRWAIYGLLGACLAVFLSFQVVLHWCRQ